MAETVVLMHVPEIEGSATLVGTDPGLDGDHMGWIPVDSCSFSFSKETSAADNPSDEEGTGPVTRVGPITVKRRADNSSAALLMWLANKDQEERKKEKVLIDYCTPQGKFYLRYELAAVELVSSSISFNAPDDLSEILTLTYRHITILQRPIDITGEVLVEKQSTAEYTAYEESE